MAKFLELLNGKRTYVIAFLGSLLALLQAFGVHVPIEKVPEWLWKLFEFSGLAALRAAVAKVEPPQA